MPTFEQAQEVAGKLNKLKDKKLQYVEEIVMETGMKEIYQDLEYEREDPEQENYRIARMDKNKRDEIEKMTDDLMTSFTFSREIPNSIHLPQAIFSITAQSRKISSRPTITAMYKVVLFMIALSDILFISLKYFPPYFMNFYCGEMLKLIIDHPGHFCKRKCEIPLSQK